MVSGLDCNVQLADEINVNQHYLPYSDICTCAGTKQLDIDKTCAVTLTGKCPPNRDPELQRTELVQGTKAVMVQGHQIGEAADFG